MRFISRGQYVLGIVCLAMSAACSSSKERKSGEARSPGGHWSEAFASVDTHGSFYKNGRNHPPGVTHSLTVREAAPQVNRVYVILASETEGNPTPQRFRELREMEYTLRWANDGHAVAASIDGGHAWVSFDLDIVANTTEAPLWCRHKTSATLDPWPSSRDLALEIFAAIDPSSPAARVHRAPTSTEWPSGKPTGPSDYHWEEEIEGAARYACLKRDDAELRAAFAKVFLWPGKLSFSTVADTCFGEIAKNDPALQQQMKAALATGDSFVKARIDYALAYGKFKLP